MKANTDRISCGCCKGPEKNRCCCWIHQDAPRGLLPHVCTRHRHLASKQQPFFSANADDYGREPMADRLDY